MDQCGISFVDKWLYLLNICLSRFVAWNGLQIVSYSPLVVMIINWWFGIYQIRHLINNTVIMLLLSKLSLGHRIRFVFYFHGGAPNASGVNSDVLVFVILLKHFWDSWESEIFVLLPSMASLINIYPHLFAFVATYCLFQIINHFRYDLPCKF